MKDATNTLKSLRAANRVVRPLVVVGLLLLAGCLVPPMPVPTDCSSIVPSGAADLLVVQVVAPQTDESMADNLADQIPRVEVEFSHEAASSVLPVDGHGCLALQIPRNSHLKLRASVEIQKSRHSGTQWIGVTEIKTQGGVQGVTIVLNMQSKWHSDPAGVQRVLLPMTLDTTAGEAPLTIHGRLSGSWYDGWLGAQVGGNATWSVWLLPRHTSASSTYRLPPTSTGHGLPAQFNVTTREIGEYTLFSRATEGLILAEAQANVSVHRRIVFADGAENGTGPWQVSNQLNPGLSPVPTTPYPDATRGWQVNAGMAVQGNHSWWTDNAAGFSGDLLGPPLKLPRDGLPHSLDFQVHGRAPPYATLHAFLLTSNVTSEAWASGSGDQYDEWLPVHVDLAAFSGGTFRVDFRYDSNNNCSTDCGSFPGYFVDDVVVS